MHAKSFAGAPERAVRAAEPKTRLYASCCSSVALLLSMRRSLLGAAESTNSIALADRAISRAVHSLHFRRSVGAGALPPREHNSPALCFCHGKQRAYQLRLCTRTAREACRGPAAGKTRTRLERRRLSSRGEGGLGPSSGHRVRKTGPSTTMRARRAPPWKEAAARA